MLVLAPDPRLGIAPERVARVRALLAAATGGADASAGGASAADDGVVEGPGRATPGVPGVVVALPGGADGLLDALVLRPDGVLGITPAPVRESVAVGAGPFDSRPSAAAADPAGVELDRLLALPSPGCAAPRRVLSSLPEGDAGETHAALRAPVGATRTIGVDDVRRVLEAFRLADHVPAAAELARVGFLTEHPSHPPTGPHPSIPQPAGGSGPRAAAAPVEDAPSIPEARRPATASTGSLTGSPTGEQRGAPVTAPLPTATASTSGALPDPRAGSSRTSGSRAGDPRPGLPATGRLSALASPGALAASRRARPTLSGRVRERSAQGLPDWARGYRGLAIAAAGAFLGALGLALATGSVVGAGGPTTPAGPDPAATRVVDGVTFTRATTAAEPTCDGHAYGQAAQFLRERPCLGLERALWTGTVDGRSVVVSVAAVRMADASSASALKSLVDTPGTGNVADLLREGRGYPGAPDRLTDAGYASDVRGDQVFLVESDRVSGAAMDAAELDDLARTGLTLR